MISEEELIKHKWKYIPESKSWKKLGVTFTDTHRKLGRYNILFVHTLTAHNIEPSTLGSLEYQIKYFVSVILSNKEYYGQLSTKQKRTLKNWIL